MKKKICVIGGGASGLMAACFASKEDSLVSLFEKEKQVARKILVTGNGRCNITNSDINENRYHGHNPKFIRNVFARFGLRETIDFFESRGVPFIEQERGRLFPSSLQASIIPKMFLYELDQSQVKIELHRRIDTITPSKNGFIVETAGKEKHSFDSVILSAGSCAYSPVGASKRGYDLARSLGHKIYEPFPAILPLNIPLKKLHKLQGIKRDCSLKVKKGTKVIRESTGELLFTAYGISGPVSLDISRIVNFNVLNNEKVSIFIDFFPAINREELGAIIESVLNQPRKKVVFSLMGLLHERLCQVICEYASIDPEMRVSDLSSEERQTLIDVLKGLEVHPGKPRSFSEAVVAAGGVDVNEINPGTMESKLHSGLFITGELLDVDGDSGGFNLQFAWSTGAIAGQHASATGT